MEMDIDRRNEFFIRANPGESLKCFSDSPHLISTEIRGLPTSNVWSYPPNPCVLDTYKFKNVEGFDLCW